ncbi:glycosyltransferase [uncultured Polaribacter sp.]|uniref:glycosyltransferase n=1 Tax=uncultured Polaribacter sp. TaxID=174711 RepID=UPI002635B7F3|nr:glycosyltransferase [uncultured Polaribacter sp.]
MKKILFITHESSRTGAPLVLLNFIKWLRLVETELQIDCLSLASGYLDNDFKEIVDNFYLLDKKEKQSILKKIYFKIIGTTYKKENKNFLIRQLKKQGYHLIYANSILSLDFSSQLKKEFKNTKLILHLHELSVSVKLYSPSFFNQSKLVDFFICVSSLVQTNIVYNYNVLINKTKIIHPFSKLKKINSLEKQNKNDQKKMIVGASGNINHRKGYDLFICVAKAVISRLPNANIEFNWIGKKSNKKIALELEADIIKADLEKTVFFKGEFKNPEKEFNLFDIFLMTSREDPFPLVCIEVGNLGTPIICFKGATGTEEVLKKGGGVIVPYLSISRMADEVINYYNNRKKIIDDGLIARENFKNYTIEEQSPKIYNVIKELI